MRIAICFYGLVGSRSDKNGQGLPLDPAIAHKYYKENIFDVNDEVDIFIHSWSIDFKDQLIELYNPKKEIIEKQKSFPNAPNHQDVVGKGINKIKMFFFKLIKRKSYDYIRELKKKEAFRAYSRWYSVNKSIQLMKNFEQEKNFRYDCVMSTRLDVSFFTPVIFKKFDMSYFYASNWNDAPNKRNKTPANFLNQNIGKGFLDFWFFSNSSLMYDFSKLYFEMDHYPIIPHTSSRKHIDTLTDRVKYVFYRWHDHEMIRRKFFESEK
jgi:hypothetical protein